MNVTIDNEIVPNACRDSIGIKGVCSDTYAYYLDSLGISLKKASGLADSATQTGKNLVEESVDAAWGMVFGDLKIKGFSVQGLTRKLNNTLGTDLVTSGSYSVELSRGCEFEQIWINKIKLKVSGFLHLSATITHDGQTLSLINDDAEDETVTITIDRAFNADSITITLTATGAGLLYSSGGSPIEYDGYIECSERLFYCRYHNYLVQAVMYKAAALILNNSIFSDRYNDIIAYSKSEIAVRISQLDSSLNLLNSENRINKSGLYQQEIIKINEKLKAIIDSGCHCGCCFECSETIQSHIAIP